MKILIVSREFPPEVLGGVSYHAYNLAMELANLGHDVEVICGKNNNSVSDNSLNLPDIDINRISFRNLPFPRYWFNKAAVKEINSGDYSDCEILHSHDYLDFEKINIDAKKILKIHYNLSMNSKFKENRDKKRKILRKYSIRPFERKWVGKVLERSEKIIYNSKLAKKICKRQHELKNQDSAIIHNGVKLNKFELSKDTEDFLLFIGGTQKRKGFDELIEAYKTADTSLNLKIAGSVNRDLIGESPKGVEIIGRIEQSELIELYKKASYLIHPALYEPFGNVILESLACGTPVIISNEKHCGAAEILGENISKQIEPEEKSLKKAIKEAEDWEVEPGECREVAEKYTWKRVAEETIDFVD